MQKRINYLIGVVVIFLIWTMASYFINSRLILPDPLVILRTMFQELSKSILWNNLFYTLLKVFTVLFLTVLFGVVIGFIIGLNETLYEIFRPFVLFIQAFPIITWLALVMFIWGIGWTGPVVVSFLSLLPHAILSTVIGIQTTDKRLIEMAQVYSVKRSKIVKDIYLGSILPQFVSTIQVVIGNVWKVVVVSEYMCGDNGIGVLIAWARQSVSVEKVYAYTMVIIIIGLFFENLVNIATKKAIQKWSIA